MNAEIEMRPAGAVGRMDGGGDLSDSKSTQLNALIIAPPPPRPLLPFSLVLMGYI